MRSGHAGIRDASGTRPWWRSAQTCLVATVLLFVATGSTAHATVWANQNALECATTDPERASDVIDTAISPNCPAMGSTLAPGDLVPFASYYASKGFDLNFLTWSPKVQNFSAGAAGWAACNSTTRHVGVACPGGTHFGPVNGNVSDGIITVIASRGAFIALACGNFSQAPPTGLSLVPTISGTKYDDRNGNGVHDSGEVPLGGVTIHLFKNGTPEGFTTTAADGTYSFALDLVTFPDRGPGTYTLTEDVPHGYHQTGGPDPIVITANPDPSALAHPGNDFENAKDHPTISTVASPAIHVGAKIFDSATLVSPDTPTGAVTFALYAPTDATCASPIATASGTLSGGTTTSGNLTASTPGVYQWVASYPGDDFNYDVKSVCGDEPVRLYAPIAATGSAITEVEGAPFTATMASFNDPDPVSTPAEYAATIDWGDGTATTAGTISQSGGVGTTFTVGGNHTYAEEGLYTATIKITDASSALNTATVTTGATVSDAALTGTGTTVAAIEGLPFIHRNIGSFIDADPAGTVSDYTASVDWGDGTATTVGEISGPDGGPFPTAGGHVYTHAGSYTITVVARDIGGATTMWTDPVAVRDAFCAGALTATDAAHVITGTVPGQLRLAGGTWIITNASVGGSITLTPGTSLMVSHSNVGGAVLGSTGGELIVSNSTVGGAVISDVGEAVAICSSTVNGAVDASATPAGVQVCATTIAGSLIISGSTAGVMVGDAGRQCATNRLTAAGSSKFAGDLSGLDVTGNTISGSLRVSHSGGTDPPLIPGGTAAPLVAGNTIAGSISCDASTPPPSNGGAANHVSGPRLGQCAASTF
jgi:hypothetical protein